MKHTKYIVSPLRFFLLLAVPFLFSATVWAVDPSVTLTTYYAGADGKTGNALRLALQDIIDGHTDIGYDYLKYLMKYSDTKDADGINVIDIYSDCEYTSGSDALSWISSGDVGAGMNREHTVPQSWFDKKSPMVGDAFHIYPTDAKSNNNRSSYLYGELDLKETVTKYTGTSGGKTYHELGGKGTSKWSSSSNPITYTLNGKNYVTTAYYSGTIYEPDDEYKGDIARGYFYMATRYASGSENANCSNWSGGAFGSDNNGLTNYTAQLMLKWHRQDPVSEKELIRNEVIYGNKTYNKGTRKQGNRNPFIDYPCLVEYIWGDSVGKNVDIAKLDSAYNLSFSGQGCPCENSSDPTLTVSSSSITIDPIATSTSSTQTFTVTGVNLTDAISITKTGSSYITFSPTSITSGYNGTNTITITYNAPASAGTHTATLTISSTGATSVTVNVSASCATAKTITWYVDGSTYTAGNPTTSVGSGGSVTQLPTAPTSGPSGCTSKVFVGWSETNIGATSQDSAPDDLFTSTSASVCQSITTNKTFYAVFADATTSGSGSVSTTVSMSSFTSVSGNDVDGDSNVSYAAAQGTATTAPAIYSNIIRIYQNGGLLTITANNEKKLTSITIGSSMATTVTYAVDEGSASSNQSISANGTFTLNNINATSVVFTCTGTSSSARLYLNSLSVTYSGTGSTTTYSNYSTQCTASSCTLSSITLNTSSVQKSFAVGDAFNYTGLVVTANYSDCVSKTVTPTSVSSPDMSTTGNKTVTVSYTESGTTKTATYTITVEAAPEYTVTFMNMGGTHATRTGTAGSAISAVSEPTACTGYTFEGWSTSQYAVDNTGTPSLSTPTTIPAGNVTYYAVYSKTEGSGGSSTDYELYSGVLTEGDYVIYYGTNSSAMKNTITSNRLSYDTPTITNDVISDPDASIVWHIAADGDYWTIYNAAVSKYAGGTTTKNQGALLESVTDYARWTCTSTISSETYTYDFENKGRAGGDSYTGNKYLRNNYANNTNYGFACYASGTGGALTLYKKANSSTTYHTTAPDCCTATITATTDDDAKGTVSVTTP